MTTGAGGGASRLGALALGVALIGVSWLALRPAAPPPASPPLAVAPPASPLGFLGAMGRGCAERIALPDPDRPDDTLAVGGVVLESLEPGSPLAKIGLTAGDVIVRVGEHWMPVKDDPTSDLIERVEGASSAGLGRVKLAYLRGGKRAEADLAFEVPAVVVGLPGPSARFAHASAAALAWLALAQRPDGGFDTADTSPSAQVAVAAMAGLCFAASPDRAHATAAARCVKYVAGRVGSSDHLGAAYASLLLAEATDAKAEALRTGDTLSTYLRQHPLPTLPELPTADFFETLQRLRKLRLAHGAGHPDVRRAQDEWEAQKAKARDALSRLEAAIGNLATEQEEARRLMTLAHGARDRYEMIATGEDVAAALAGALEIILKAQDPTGAWPASPPGTTVAYCDRTFATTACLAALGAAERAGCAVDNAKVQLGLSALEAAINGGYPGYAGDPSFDRRSEAARAAAAVVAMGSLSVRLTEPMPIRLIEYEQRFAKEITRAPTSVYPGLLASALCARRLGLPAWLSFHAEFAVPLLALQRLDGSFAPTPGAPDPRELPFLAAVDGPAWRTAHGALALLLDRDALPVLRLTQPAWSRERDGSGAIVSADSAPDASTKPPKGDMEFASVEEAIKFMKDSLGLKDDDPQIKKLREMMGEGSGSK